jgi:hypothetical protein
MYVGGVLHDDHVLALQAADAEVSAGLRGVGEQSLLEFGIVLLLRVAAFSQAGNARYLPR